MFGRKLEPEQVTYSIEGRKIEEGKSTMLLDRYEPFISGGIVTDSSPLGGMGCRVFTGAAALAGMELARQDRERFNAAPSRGDGNSLDARLHRLGINPRRR